MDLLEKNGLTPQDLEPVDRIGDLELKQDTYETETDAALFDLDAAQATYETDTDAALFDLAEYAASLEARIQALEA